MSAVSARPWYREPLVWMLIAIPASAVLMAAVMIPLAVVSNDGLVSDDYYQRGLRINQILDRDKRARGLGIELAAMRVSDAGLRLRLEAAEPGALPPAVDVRFSHATRADHDARLRLPRVGEGRYAGPLPALPAGAWNVEIGTAEWRLVHRYVTASGQAASGAPAGRE